MKIAKFVFFFVGTGLLLTNLYGMTQSLKPNGLTPEVLRFGVNDVSINHEDLKNRVKKKVDETDEQFSRRITYDLAAGMAHLKWQEYDPDKYHQRVPVWENYILYIVGVLSPIPEFERYHFTNPQKSIERGIGICGDASMTLSGLLDENKIENKIVSMPGHVMVEAYVDKRTLLLDADFGVVLDNGIDYYKNATGELIETFQTQLGRQGDGELVVARGVKEGKFKHWDGTKHFVTKKYYFEKAAYLLKWLIPFFLLMVALILHVKNNKK
jgi:hypothetical protein